MKQNKFITEDERKFLNKEIKKQIQKINLRDTSKFIKKDRKNVYCVKIEGGDDKDGS